MADTKISALTASTTPLAGTEVLPIVQSSTTKKVAVSDLTAGRAVSAASLALTSSPLPTTSGGTALTSFTANGIVYASSTSALATSSGLTFDGTNFSISTSGNPVALLKTSGGGNNPLYRIQADTNYWDMIGVFSDSDDTYRVRYNNTDYFQINNAGEAKINVGNLAFASGKGIDFSATPGTGTSELFADYEEGTFTPTLIGTTTNPTVTYTLQRGVYTKVGRIVTVSVYMGWSAFSGGSGNVAFGNLPFTIESSVGSSCGGSIANFDGFTLSAARTSVGLLGAANTTYGAPTCFGSAVSSQYIGVGSVAASGSVIYTLTYSV
jgi:hypothetical protein